MPSFMWECNLPSRALSAKRMQSCLTLRILFVWNRVGADGAVYDDVWWFDTAVNGWEFVAQPSAGLGYAQFTRVDICTPASVNAEEPGGRAGHAMASTGFTALMCGGYTAKEDGSATTYAESNGNIDCWWLTPRPTLRWDRMLLKAGATAPSPREGHVMQYNDVSHHILLHGGLNSENQAQDDCWYIDVNASSAMQSTSFTMEFEWKPCLPTANASLTPSARYGHGSVFFDATATLYVWGGFQSGPGVVYVLDDMWLFRDDTTNQRWEQVLATSTRPAGRAFHAMWLFGSLVLIHGGQGESGEGVASVLSDSWSFDLYTGVWMQFGTSDAVPVASHIAVLGATETLAVSFGGKGKDGLALGQLFTFVSSAGWSLGKRSHLLQT